MSTSSEKKFKHADDAGLVNNFPAEWLGKMLIEEWPNIRERRVTPQLRRTLGRKKTNLTVIAFWRKDLQTTTREAISSGQANKDTLSIIKNNTVTKMLLIWQNLT